MQPGSTEGKYVPRTDCGELRAQSAYSDAKRPVVIVTEDEELKKMLLDRGVRLVVTQFYPDTTDAEGKFSNPGGTFKIAVALGKL